MTFPRKTSISRVENESVSLRGTPIEELMGNVSWAAAVYLLLTGVMPDENRAKMLEAIFVAVLDHGVRPPSTIAAVTTANTGAPLNAAVAAGILAINKYHGGAIEEAMSAISEAVKIQEIEKLEPAQAAAEIYDRYKLEGKRISGFGHRFHAADPRTVRLFEIAKDLRIAGKYIAQAQTMEKVLSEKAGKNLPINADGAIAACLLEMDFPPKIANGIFMIARVAGLVAHAVEEQENHPPMRTVDVENYEFLEKDLNRNDSK